MLKLSTPLTGLFRETEAIIEKKKKKDMFKNPN